MTGTHHPAFTIERRVSTRRVQPGGGSSCAQCRAAIDYLPGGGRFLVSIATYDDGALQSTDLFHTECYVEIG